MDVTGLDHAAIKTEKLEETRRFFEGVLGLTVGPRPAFDFNGYWLYAGRHDLVHLVETDAAKTPSSGAAINHFALRVADYEATIADLKAKAVPFETETTPGGELRQIYVTDPNGVRIELNSPGGAR
jgi:catechol 2,3-dioxygenase-like lactoylglutathione lyase family enzyme